MHPPRCWVFLYSHRRTHRSSQHEQHEYPAIAGNFEERRWKSFSTAATAARTSRCLGRNFVPEMNVGWNTDSSNKANQKFAMSPCYALWKKNGLIRQIFFGIQNSIFL